MAATNPYGSGRFKINVNRVKSKKWKDADKVDYGGGWGDDDSDDGYDEPAPVSADNPRHPAWNAPPNAYPSNRSVTNPSPTRAGQRPSFDHGDERRHFPSAGNFDSPYPTTQRSPFPELQHDNEPSPQNYAMHPALRLNTQDQGPMVPTGFRPGSRGRQYPPYEDVPMSAPGSFPRQNRSGSSNRPSGDAYAVYEGPMRPESRSSQTSHRQFPPRKQSLTQPRPPSDFTQGSHSPAPSHTSATATAVSANEDRPPPAFIRPSDIYKRMNEEMEKVRKSQDSSRPSTASEPNKVRESSVGARSTISDPKEATVGAQPLAEDSDSTRRLKPTLDPVPERKSEYGFENLVKAPSHDDNAQSQESPTESDPVGISRHGTNGSSIYTDRPDPVSASTLSRNVSMSDIPPRETTAFDRPNFGLPPIGRMSGFGMDTGLTDRPASRPVLELSQPSSHIPNPTPSKDVGTGENEELGVRGLRSQPTMGYTSVVHQAFDHSQHQPTPLGHSSTSSTIDRSNSGSTADISPIISRKPDPGHTPTVLPITRGTIPEESLQTETRQMSSSVGKPREPRAPQDDDFSPPVTFRPGFRRDITPPSRDNSPAKKPLEFGPRGVVRPQHGSLGDEEPAVQERTRGRAQSIKDKPLPAEPKAGPPIPNITSPLAPVRTDSPPKGTVRDLAGRLESSSGRSSPTNSSTQVPLPGLTQGRPPPQARYDSFRPAIPGGWQSYSSSAGPGTPGTSTPGTGDRSPPRPRFAQPRTQSTESIPTARAPASIAPREDGLTRTAFAAAASAGSALAGALAGYGVGQHDPESSQQPSEEESENEWDHSSSSSDGNSQPPASPALLEEQAPEGRSRQHLQATPLAAGIPLPSATRDQPQSVAASTPLSVATSSEADVPDSTLDYFPAPLRTSRSIDPASFRPPIPNVAMPQETPPDSENERLQQEIVKSLTPKSSNLAAEPSALSDQPRTSSDVLAHRAVTNAEAGSHKTYLPPSVKVEPRRDDPRMISASESAQVPDAEAVFTASHPPLSAASRSAEVEMPNSDTGQNTSVTPEPFSAAFPSSGSEPRLDAALAGTGQSPQSQGQDVPTSGKPFLKQRFSWETGSSPPASVTTPKQTNSPHNSSPDTIRAPYQPGPSNSENATSTVASTKSPIRQATLPVQQPAPPMQSSAINSPQASAPIIQPPTSAATRQFDSSPQASSFTPITASSSLPQRPLSGEPAAFRTILNLGSPVERMKAFDDSRQFYAAPNEQLQSWLMSMKTPEHSELFATNGRLSLDTSESSMSHKPSPRRILTNPAGAKQMQEDGKKLMAAAGRFGGKAGNAAKGLFAKGKEKMRNASSGEKGMLTSRRKSSGPLPDGSDDVSAPSQPRHSTYLEGPPQIPLNITPASPLSTPTEWFPNRGLGGSQTSRLSTILPQPTASSTAPAVHAAPQSTADQERGTPHGSVATVAAAIPALAPSPAISALDSESAHQEDVGVPSRSISQLTKPTDHSPVESPHTANVERSGSQRETSAPAQAILAGRSDPPATTLAPPPPFTDRHDGSMSDAESSDRSLQVPQANRRSIISDVSSASPSPEPDTDGHNMRRSVSLSPADDVRVSSISEARIGQNISTAEALSADRESQAAEQSVAVAGADSNVRPQTTLTSEPPHARASLAVEAVEPRRDPEQVPQQPAQQREAASEQYDAGQYRPFSFAGIEGVGAIHHSQQMHEQDLSRIPSQPMSPISQTRSDARLSKEMSQVSVDEVTDQVNSPGQRQPRSYSRPFGVDPNVRNHPALRTNEPEQPSIDRAQMYSSESPLPSAKRPQEDGQRVPQQREQQRSPMPHQPRPYEQGYRIPGPYVQEYRSPKQISSPKNGRSPAQVQASGMPLPSTTRTQSYTGQTSPQPQSGRNSYLAGEQPNAPSYQEHSPHINSAHAYAEYDMKPEDYQIYSQNRPVQQQQQSMGPPPLPAQQQTPIHATPAQQVAPQPQAERKKSTFGKFFGSSTSKGSRLQKDRAPTPVDNVGNQHKEKRGSMLRRNESVSSKQSSKHGSRDQLGQLPPPNMPSHSARRQSRDVLRSITPDNGDRPQEAKKKRFSGLGSKLFKSSSTARAATAPTPPTHGTGSEHQRTDQHVMSPGPYAAQNPRMMSPDPYSAHTPYSQYPAGPGSYFQQGQMQSPHPQSAYPRGQAHAQTAQYPTVTSPYHQQQRSSDYGYPAQSPPPQSQQQPAGSYGSGVYMSPTQNRPSDLRIDTGSQNRDQSNAPATAPAQVHGPRRTPFASAPYNPNPSPGATTTTTTTTDPTSPSIRTPNPPANPRAHVIDLHKRSRSPRLGRTASDDLDAQRRAQPTNLLGTFSSKNISPAGGVRRSENDQERPFAITVPGLDDHDSSRRNKHNPRDRIAAGVARSDTPVSVASSGHPGASHAPPSTSPSSNANAGHLDRNVSVLEGYNSNIPTNPREARRSSARDKTTPAGVIAELPGSKAEGYESEEEIPMSATAYPGQEWMPVFVGDGRWDD